MERTLTSAEARRYYERHTALQDRQGWYEDAAIDWLIERARFARAGRVLEIGCGTGRMAAHVEGIAKGEIFYCGIDISAEMLKAARRRLPDAHLVQVDVTQGLPFSAAQFDRVIATYLLDLLSEEDARALFGEIARVTAPGALLVLASLSREAPPGVPRAIGWLWGRIQRLAPSLVGGCRPVDMVSTLPDAHWDLVDHAIVTPWSIASEVLIAKRR